MKIIRVWAIRLLLAYCALWLVFQNQQLRLQNHHQKTLTKKYSQLLATCMNGGVLYDKLGDTAHFCDHVISIQLGTR